MRIMTTGILYGRMVNSSVCYTVTKSSLWDSMCCVFEKKYWFFYAAVLITRQQELQCMCSLCNMMSLTARFMGPIWGRQGPGGPHVGPMNLAIWGCMARCDAYNQHGNHWYPGAYLEPSYWHENTRENMYTITFRFPLFTDIMVVFPRE